MSQFLRKARKNFSLLLGSSLYRFNRIPKITRPGATKFRVQELAENYGTQLREMMKRSHGERVEYGCYLCTQTGVTPDQFTRGEGTVVLGPIIRGHPYKVQLRDCRDGLWECGSVHSHWQVGIFSPEDLAIAMRRELLTCLLTEKNGATYLRCVSPGLAWQYPVRTRLWMMSALWQVDNAFKHMVELAERHDKEWSRYRAGLIRYEDMSPEARRAYDSFQYYYSLTETVLPAVEKLLDIASTRL